MPHDADNNAINVGDLVYIPCTVEALHEGNEYCNIDVAFYYPMPPYTDKTRLSLNTKQVQVERWDRK